MPIKTGIVLLSILSLFIFPYPLTTFLAFCAALIFPPLAIGLGMLMDLLYEPSGYWPVASVIGIVFCLLAYAVRSFVKTRIM